MPDLTRQEAEDFLYREAELLDERRLEDWAQLFTEDGLFWVPMTERGEPGDRPSVFRDDGRRRAMRIHQLTQYTHLAQSPPSRTIHLISNVRVENVAEGQAIVRCNTVVHELRPGDHQEAQVGMGNARQLAAGCEYRLRYDGGWRIAEKKMLLLERDLPLYNLTFIF